MLLEAVREILDTLIALPKTTPNHDQLQQLVASHLEDFKRIHGAEHWTTKFHLSLHLPLLLTSEETQVLDQLLCPRAQAQVRQTGRQQRLGHQQVI